MTISIADLENSKIDIEKYHGAPATEEVSSMLVIRKPAKHWFVTANPNPEYSYLAGILEHVEEGSFSGEIYLVSEPVARAMGSLVKICLLTLAKTSHGVRFIWTQPPPRPPNDKKRISPYISAHLEAAKLAKTKWVRMVSDQDIKSYKIHVWEDKPGQPQTYPPISWSEEIPFSEYLQKSFDDRFIKTMDHPIVKYFIPD